MVSSCRMHCTAVCAGRGKTGGAYVSRARRSESGQWAGMRWASGGENVMSRKVCDGRACVQAQYGRTHACTWVRTARRAKAHEAAPAAGGQPALVHVAGTDVVIYVL